MTTPELPDVSICICTYKRAELLGQLLESLARQTFPLEAVEMIVVDNDQAASAMGTVESFISQHKQIRIRYAIEPVQGISYARNRTVEMATGKLLAFIDDDETASPCWLEELVLTMREQAADVVLGPVITVYPAGTRNWVKDSHFFDRPRYPTGVVASDVGGTGNVLVKADLIKLRRPQPFSESLAQSGGEDYDLMQWLESQGAKLVWCDAAEVHETLASSRQSVGFVLERGLRSSVIYWRNQYVNWHWTAILFESVKGTIGGIMLLLFGFLLLPVGLGKTMRIWNKGLKGIGRVIALTDIPLVGYSKKA